MSETNSTKPYWLDDAEIGQGVYIGFVKGEWPIHAFSASLTHHLDWVANDPDRRVLVGPIFIPDDLPFLTVERIPVQINLIEVTS